MNFKQLEALLYVSKCGTFKKAAEALYFDSPGKEYITPESIQYRIKQLEQELGVSLYRRRQGSSSVLLTREGKLFTKEAMEIYQRMLEWREMFLETRRGTITFCATQAVLIHRLLEPIKSFKATHPKVTIRAFNAPAVQIEENVAGGRIDFGFSTRPPEDPELEYILWRRSNMVLVTPLQHPLAGKKEVKLEDAVDYPLILLEPEIHGDRELVDEAFRNADIKRPNIIMETSNSEIILAFVEAGMGISIIAETAVLKTPRNVKVMKLGSQIGKSEVGLLIREGQYLPLYMKEFLCNVDKKFEQWLSERDARNAKVAEESISQLERNNK
jgi:DNA-binding transcriptional LysR family regulator